MALLFCDSFDHYDTAHMHLKWTTAASIAAGMGRRAGAAMTGSAGKAVPDSSTLITGFAFNPQNSSSNFVWFQTDGRSQLTLNVTPSGAITVYAQDGSVLATTAPSVLNMTGYSYVECKVTFATTPLGSVTLRVNSTIVLALTNVTTAYGVATANSIQYTSYGGYFDDLYICDGTGTANQDFLGDVTVALALPSGNGRASQWARTGGSGAGNYTAVNEVPPDDDVSYVASSTPGAIDAYAIAPVGTPAAVKAVQITAVVRKDDSGSRSVALGFGNGVTESFGPGTSVGDSYTVVALRLDQNPLTATAFTPADLASGQMAIQVVS